GVPVVLHEQNAIPGLTNRLLARLARTVAVSFAESTAAFARSCVLTGNPVRAAFFAIPPVPAPAPGPAVSAEPLRLLVFGGSLGAHVLNRTLTAALPLLAGRGLAIVHQTGERELEEARAAYARSALPGA